MQACSLPNRNRPVSPSKTTIASGACSTRARNCASLVVSAAVRSATRRSSDWFNSSNSRSFFFRSEISRETLTSILRPPRCTGVSNTSTGNSSPVKRLPIHSNRCGPCARARSAQALPASLEDLPSGCRSGDRLSTGCFRTCLEKFTELLLAFTKRGFRALALRDIARNHHGQAPATYADRGGQYFQWNFLSVEAAAHPFEPVTAALFNQGYDLSGLFAARSAVGLKERREVLRPRP